MIDPDLSTTARPTGFVMPVVRELPRPDATRQAPPHPRVGVVRQRDLVRASLLGLPPRR